MNKNFDHLNKFGTIETIQFSNAEEKSIIQNIHNFNFFHPSPEYRKFKILDCISKNAKISQKQISEESDIVPAMVNKYIQDFRKEQIIIIAGDNNKNTRYYLTSEGKKLREKYLFQYIGEILILYKGIKEEINIKLLKITKYSISRNYVLFGANEISELIMHSADSGNIKINGIVDSNPFKIGRSVGSFKILPPDQIGGFGDSDIIITSLSKYSEIYASIKHLESDNIKIYIFAEL